jgi:hypothetical protein
MKIGYLRSFDKKMILTEKQLVSLWQNIMLSFDICFEKKKTHVKKQKRYHIHFIVVCVIAVLNY